MFWEEKGDILLTYFVYFLRTWNNIQDFLEVFRNPDFQKIIQDIDMHDFQWLFDIEQRIQVIHSKIAFKREVDDVLSFRLIWNTLRRIFSKKAK